MIASLIIIIFIAIIALTAGIMKKRGKSYYSRKVSWFLGGYMAILLICMALVNFLPERNMTHMKRVNMQELEKENTVLYSAELEGKIDKVAKKYLATKWSFNYHEPKLNVEVENHEAFNIGIIVERKKTNDHKIEAVYYKSRSGINGIDVTGMTKPIDVKLTGNTLILMKQSMVKINFSQFENVFSIDQFTGGRMFNHESNFFEGQSILYLRIPKNLHLINQSEMNLEFVK